jgi:hypothetical protein
MDLETLRLIFVNFRESLFLAIGAVSALLFMYLRDYRLSEFAGKRSYMWYLLDADPKKTDDVLIILIGLIAMEAATGALTGLEPIQVITTGVGLGIATKVRAGG